MLLLALGLILTLTRYACSSIQFSKPCQPQFNQSTSASFDVIYGQLTLVLCRAAITKLPMEIGDSLFSRTSADPRYRLPAYGESGDCVVEVALSPKQRSETGSWPSIREIAEGVVLDCVGQRGQGGWAVTGQEGKIKVTLHQTGYAGSGGYWYTPWSE